MKGETVRPGTKISQTGSTGNSTGPHLHLSMWHNGSLQSPLAALRSHGVKMGYGGVARATAGGLFANIAERGQDELVTPLPRGFVVRELVRNSNSEGGTVNNYDFSNATFEFPNITDADEAEEFLKNLAAQIKD
jgi:hypothetical protein